MRVYRSRMSSAVLSEHRVPEKSRNTHQRMSQAAPEVSYIDSPSPERPSRSLCLLPTIKSTTGVLVRRKSPCFLELDLWDTENRWRVPKPATDQVEWVFNSKVKCTSLEAISPLIPGSPRLSLANDSCHDLPSKSVSFVILARKR